MDKTTLSYYKTFLREYQWFLLYEFEIESIDIYDKTDELILKNLIATKILGEALFHSNMDNQKLTVAVQNVSRPYKFNKLDISDFQFIPSKVEFEKWIVKFRNDGWQDDKVDAQILINQALNEIWSRTNLENGVWHLSKEQFEWESSKLDEFHCIYAHFETFIEIDKRNKLIRTFDFGYD